MFVRLLLFFFLRKYRQIQLLCLNRRSRNRFKVDTRLLLLDVNKKQMYAYILYIYIYFLRKIFSRCYICKNSFQQSLNHVSAIGICSAKKKHVLRFLFFFFFLFFSRNSNNAQSVFNRAPLSWNVEKRDLKNCTAYATKATQTKHV